VVGYFTVIPYTLSDHFTQFMTVAGSAKARQSIM